MEDGQQFSESLSSGNTVESTSSSVYMSAQSSPEDPAALGEQDYLVGSASIPLEIDKDSENENEETLCGEKSNSFLSNEVLSTQDFYNQANFVIQSTQITLMVRIASILYQAIK